MGIHIEERHGPGMSDLKDELASLKIDRDPPKRRRWGMWIFVLLLLAAVSAAGLYLVKTKPELTNFAAVEVEAVSASGTDHRRARARERRS